MTMNPAFLQVCGNLLQAIEVVPRSATKLKLADALFCFLASKEQWLTVRSCPKFMCSIIDKLNELEGKTKSSALALSHAELKTRMIMEVEKQTRAEAAAISVFTLSNDPTEHWLEAERRVRRSQVMLASSS